MRWETCSASHTPGVPFDTREYLAHSPGPFADVPKKKGTAVIASVALDRR